MSLEIYIGPNGYGKTTKLNDIKKDLINSGVSEDEILFLDSEILLLDEVKDTKDQTKTMEFILSEIFSTPNVVRTKNAFETAIDNEINANLSNVNSIVDQVLALSGSNRNVTIRGTTTAVDFIEVTPNKEYKKLVKINNKKLVSEKMGSGQRMQFILSLVKNSSKSYIILDEPEKYSHPSLLNRTAELITDLSRLKEVFIATHSSKLLSMIDMDFTDLYIINDNTHTPKQIDFSSICSAYTAHRHVISRVARLRKSLSYFNATDLISNIKKLHYRNFLEGIFSKKVYIVEGVNDSLFINKMLLDNNKFFDDYTLFYSYGKHHMMLFADIFESLGIEVHLYFDEDNVARPEDLSTNTILRTYVHHYMFNSSIESEISFTGDKRNTVDFINYLETYTVPNTFLC